MNAPNRPALSEAVQLAPTFDADRLAQELAEVTDHRWQPQRIHASGGVGAAATIDWLVLPLRSPGGDADRTDPGGPGTADFVPTVWLDRLPYLRAILDSVPAPLNAVRLMALGPGAASQPHSDPKYALNRGMVRLHIPLITNPAAVLVLGGVEHCWQPGQLWYGDFLPGAPGTQYRPGRPSAHRHRRSAHPRTDRLVPSGLASRAGRGRRPVQLRRTAANALPRRTPGHDDAPARVHRLRQRPRPGRPPPASTHHRCRCGPVHPGRSCRVFALAPVGVGEYRFAGWSEQRTLQFTDDGVLLRVRHGRALQELHIAATAGLR